MATHARQQYFADENSLSKERREFSIADEIQEKIDSVEEGAQVNTIETVKVNGAALTPDANKAVNVEVPDVIDNLYSTSTDDALSAKQGKVLYDYIQNIASRGRFLSNWNSVTGLPMTNPSESPYPYKSGDYFVVSNVAGLGGTNYRPDGSSYIIGQASTVVETDTVDVSDFYFYDGTNWLLLKNSGRSGAVDSSLSTTSTNPVENRVITNALNGKQDILIAGTNVQIAADGKTISATDTTYSAGTNISIDANNEISAVDTKYTAGANVQISNQNVISATDTVYGAGTNIQINGNIISATDTTYTAGTGINIDSNNVISNTQTSAEWGNITGTLSDQTDLQTVLNAKQDALTAGTGIDITSNTISAKGLTILSYGSSNWNDFITAYNAGAIVYCRASSNTNPGTGTQGRMAFMAYLNNPTTPTEVEFQYYRSVSTHSSSQQGDQVFVYKLTNASGGTWTVTTREASSKIVTSTGLTSSYSNDTLTLSNTGVTSVNSSTGAVTVNDIKVASSAPATPTEGMAWYDTTNDVLKTYDGSNWNECGAGGGIEIFPMYQYGLNTDWTDIIDSCANNNTFTILLDVWEDDYATQTGWVKWLVTEYDDGATSGTGRISAMALFNLNGVGSAVPYPKSNKLVVTFNATTKYCTGITQSYTEFVPANSGSTGNVLTKTANGYEWSAPSGGGDVLVSSQANNILTSGMKIRAGLESDYQNLGSRDSNTLYLTVE